MIRRSNSVTGMAAPGGYRFIPLSCWPVVCLTLMWAVDARAEEYIFSPALLQVGSAPKTAVDLSLFSSGQIQPPGEYRVDILLNDVLMNTRVLTFRLQKDEQGKEQLQPCLNVADLAELGVNTSAYPALQEEDCVNIQRIIPGATVSLLFNQQQLKLSIPQAALLTQARGHVSPERWDNGITSLLSNYSFSGSQNRARSNGQQDSRYFLNLDSGANWRAWRLRNSSTWSRDSQGTAHWQSISTYLQRDIVQWKSLLTLGDTATTSDVFDSISFRGAQLASVDAMYPDSLNGYSPVVRGVARSSAQVTIRQNGRVIEQRHVPPGAFEITDLYALSGSGDLDVTITESDGSEQLFVVPFASLPILQREGRLSYSATAGQYRPVAAGTEPSHFLQSTLIYGLPWGMTLYGGTQLASRYRSLAIGAGKNMGSAGALSLDVTQGWWRLRWPGQPAENSQGQMWRVRYGKSFDSTGTQLSLAGYRYATRSFATLQRALDNSPAETDAIFPASNAQSRGRKELSIQQSLGDLPGSFTLSLLEEDFWDNTGTQRSIVFGYNSSLKGISYSVNYSQNKNGNSGTDRLFSLNVSVPLQLWSNPVWTNYSLSNSNNGQTMQMLGVNGTALADSNLNWGISQGYTNQGEGASSNLNLAYNGSKARLSTSYSHDRHQQSLNYALQGGVLLHADGLTLSQPLNDTMILVKAPGAGGVKVLNHIGITTDSRGYAVVPYGTPYRENKVGLDPRTLANNVELLLTSKTVIPTQGAVVLADYQTRVGSRMMMTLQRPAGKAVPFGALVTLSGSAELNSHIVGDGGQVYLTGMPDSGVLQVRWGAQPEQQCRADYRLPPPSSEAGIPIIEAQCL